MFFSKEQMKKKEEENSMRAKVEGEFMDFIATMMLESESVPEEDKWSIRVILTAKRASNAIHDLIVTKYATPGNEANAETLKEVAEYLALVEKGIVQFSESTPFVKRENK